MKISVSFILLSISASLSLNAVEIYDFNSTDSWESSSCLQKKTGYFTLTKSGNFLSSDFYPIDKNATCVASMKVRKTPGSPAYLSHIGFYLYDASKIMLPSIWYRVENNSNSILTAAAKAESKTVTILRPNYFPADILRRRWSIVFHATDNFSDLPNRTANRVVRCKEVSETEIELTLANSLQENYKAGTQIRFHSSGPEMYSLINGKPLSDDWTEISAIIKGEAAILSNRKWRKEAMFFKLLISNTPTTADRNVKIDFKDVKIMVQP